MICIAVKPAAPSNSCFMSTIFIGHNISTNFNFSDGNGNDAGTSGASIFKKVNRCPNILMVNKLYSA